MFDVERKPAPNKKKIKRGMRLSDDTKKTIVIVGAIFIVVFMLSFIYISKQNENYKNTKEDKSKYIVYTKYQGGSGDYSQYIPYINIKSDVISLVNEDVDLFMEDFKGAEKTAISYEYDISGIILSVVLKAIDYNTEYAPKAYFRSYNINLNTLEVIDDTALLNFFGVTEETVNNKIENKFKTYYQELVNESYYAADECDYNCFLRFREVDNYLDNVTYYVENGNLIAYKPYVFHSVYGEEEYFKNKSFKFLIVETDKNGEDK